ncbi:hypothetical protein BH11ACT7_BH11ACT7_06350 [soil metagenome]
MQTMWIPKLSAAVIMLGLGAAAVNGAAMAAASPAESDGSSSSSSSSGSASKSSPSESDSDPSSSPARPTTKRDADTDKSPSKRSAADEDATPKLRAASKADKDEDAPSEEASPQSDTSQSEVTEPSEVIEPAADTEPSELTSPSEVTAPSEVAEPADEPESGSELSVPAAPAPESIAVQPVTPSTPAAHIIANPAEANAAVADPENAGSEMSVRPADPFDPLTAVMSQLLAAVGLIPPAGAGPSVPPAPQSGTVLLDALGRWFSQILVSQAPTASPLWVSQSETGVITGTLAAVDAAGNPLTYKVTEQPTNGTVVIDADGTFYFTPNVALAATGGVDGFTVEVSNGVRSLFVSDAAGMHLALWNAAPISVPVNLILRSDNAIGTVANVNRFWVINTSSRRLMWRGFIENDGATGPYPDIYIDPGQEVYFDMASSIGSRQSFVTTFSEDGVFTSYAYGIYATQSGWGVQDGNCWGGSCYVKDGWAFFLQDAPNTNININAATDPSGAKNALLSLCREGSRAVCDFTPTRQEKTWGTAFELTQVINGGTGPITQEISETRSASQTDSVEISAEASSKLSDLLNLKIAAKYGHSWTKSQTFGYKLTVPVPAQSAVSIWARNPVDRVYGTFTIQMGNTKWTVDGIYFDTPDASRIPSMEIKPLTPTSAGPAEVDGEVRTDSLTAA